MTTWKLFWTILGTVVSIVAATLLHLVPLPVLTAALITTPAWTATGAVLGCVAGAVVLRSALGAAVGFAVGAGAAMALGFVAEAVAGAAIPIMAAIVIGAVIVLVVTRVTRFVMLGAACLKGVPAEAIETYSNGVGLATALHLAWIVATWVVDGRLVILVISLAVLVLLEYWTAVAWEYFQAHRKPKTPHNVPRRDLFLIEALAIAGYPHLSIVESEFIGHNPETRRPDGVRWTLQLEAGKKEPGPSAGKDIANALKKVLGKPLKTDWVQFRVAPGAGEYVLTMTERDTKADVIPYRDSIEPTSITEPCLFGYDHDEPVTRRLDVNGQNIGKAGSGKSSLTNVQLAHLTRCTDAIVWVCGVEKLYELVGEWLEPYDDEDYDLPFDWVAHGQEDLITMLITAMNVARWRQRQPKSTRIGWPYIIVILDEASFAFRNTITTGLYQGQWINASQAAANLTQGGRSGNVFLVRNSQRSTLDHGGPGGGDISANMGWTAAFMSKDYAEIGRLTNKFLLEMPKHTGEFWFDPGTGDPVLLKAPYIQEVDPNRPVLHEGLTVGDVAWSRRHLTHSLDPGSTAIAGDAYARRHTRMNEAMRSYLTGEPTIQQPAQQPIPAQWMPGSTQTSPSGQSSSYQLGYDMMMQQLTEMFPDITPPPLAAAPPQSAPPAPVDQSAGVVIMAGRRSRTDRVADIVNGSAEPMTRGEIAARVGEEEGKDVSIQAVTNILTELTGKKRIQRLEHGLYGGLNLIISSNDQQQQSTP